MVLVNKLDEMWNAQLNSQMEMGLNPGHLSDRVRDDELKNMLLGLQEQAVQLALASTRYKQHIVNARPIDRSNAAERVADVIKYALAIAQTLQIDKEALFEAFMAKTRVVLDRHRSERATLQRDSKIVCVDVDDVVADLASLPSVLPRLAGGEPRRHHALVESFKDDLHSSGVFRELPPVPGAVEALRKFKDKNWTIVLITARPVWQFQRIYADTLYWLDKHAVPRDVLLFNKDKVEAVYERLNPAWPRAFVEDDPRNALALASAGILVLLYDRPRNRDLPETPNIIRVMNWQEVTRYLGVDDDGCQGDVVELDASSQGDGVQPLGDEQGHRRVANAPADQGSGAA